MNAGCSFEDAVDYNQVTCVFRVNQGIKRGVGLMAAGKTPQPEVPRAR